MAKEKIQEDLEEALTKDISGSRAKLEEYSKATGAGGGLPEGYMDISLIQKGKAVGEFEIASTRDAVNELLKQITQEAGIVDQTKAAQFQMQLKKKLHGIQKEMITQAGLVDRQLAQMGADAASRQRTQEAIASISKNVGYGIASSYGKAPAADTTPTTDPAIAAANTTSGSQRMQDYGKIG